MTGLSADSFHSYRSPAVAGRTFTDYSIQAAEGDSLEIEFRPPISLKVLLDDLLRFDDDRSVTLDRIDAMTDSVERDAPIDAKSRVAD